MDRWLPGMLRFVIGAALVVAMQPLIDFLILPPEGSEIRWLVTAGALAVALIGAFYLRELRIRRETSERAEG